MKTITSILLLFALTLQSGSRLWIHLAFQWQQNEIARSLCINRFERIPICKGSCVLEKELNKDAGEQQKSPSLKLEEVILDQPVAFATSALALAVETSVKLPVFDSPPCLSSFNTSVFKPPATNA